MELSVLRIRKGDDRYRFRVNNLGANADTLGATILKIYLFSAHLPFLSVF